MKEDTYDKICKRFRSAAELIFEDWGEMRRFCFKNNINYTNFHSALKAERRKIQPSWIIDFCSEYKFSANWIFLGKGKAMMD